MNDFIVLWIIIAAMLIAFGLAMTFIERARDRDRDPIPFPTGPEPDYELERRAARISSDIWLANWRDRPAQRAHANRPWDVE